MATYTLTAGDRGAYSKTLTAATVDTVTFVDDFATIEVYGDGTSPVYFTVGTVAAPPADPVAGAGSTYELPLGSAAVRSVKSPQLSPPVVKLISAGTPKYSVSGE